MSAEQRHRLQQQFERGRQLMEQPPYQFDDVHALLADCVIHDPGNPVFVEALLENLRRKFDDNKRGSRMAGFRGQGGFKQAVSDENWDQVLQLGPNVLKYNPWDTDALRGLARACAARGYGAVEVQYLQIALEAGTEDVELNRHAARSLARLGEFQRAIRCWQRVEELDPYDDEAARMIATLTLEKTRSETHAEEAGEPEDTEPAEPAETIRDKRRAARVVPKKPPRQLVFTPRQELEQAIVNNPEDEENYLKLAELHLAENRTYEARQTLLKAMAVSSNLRILERLEDVNMIRARQQIEIAERRAAEEKTSEAHELVKSLRDESHRLELEVYRARCERYPDDARLKFQLGIRLKQVGNYRAALEPLQAGLEVPEHRAVASLEIGEILQRHQQFPKALQCYRQAAQLAATDPEQAPCRRRALYRAGVLATSMKLIDSARQYLGELVEVDPEYRDAKARLDSLDEIGHDS
jgi:tetratricopeptide (TPR) repeat protein